MTVAGKTFTVQQDGACTYSIKPGSYSAGRDAVEVLVSVTAGDGCAWTAASNASWVSIAEGRAGSGNGTVRLLVPLAIFVAVVLTAWWAYVRAEPRMAEEL